jgi:LysR family transcriptional regulator, hydrogen peroxide-inducible genes activator
MEMHQLRYVVAIARTGNFSRAAEQCHVAQPSLSQQIRKLEDELGERLFDRLKREAKLTAAGEVFLLRALRILGEVDAAKREAHDARELLRGTLSIGVLPTIAPFLLPDVIAEFSEAFPGMELIVQEETTSRLLKLAAACEIDLGIASLPINDPRFEIRELFSEELLLALPPGHALARQRKLSVSDLESERFILMQEGHCLGEQVLSFCDRSDLHPTVSFRSAQMATIQALVRAGLGISLIPAMAVAPEGVDAPIYRSLQKPRPSRKIVAFWPRQRPPGRAGAEFLAKISSQRRSPKR